MKPEQWDRIEDVLAEALALRTQERARYLDLACAGDATLRAEVASLLAEHDDGIGVLDRPPAWLPDHDHVAEPAIDSIGPWRVLRAIGRGGMGQVYLAERDTVDFRQTVAIKVIRRGLDTDDLIARFRNERRILARLDHPNIARLIDVGATEQGRPYFVMEHVDGVPIIEYCDRNGLAIAERLRLFQSVCAAVHHAHRSLVVHRDLKPNNILVTQDGIPKLLDFGIAKILEADDAEGPAMSPHTRTDVRVLTPAFCAPEQIRGEAVTTACDVYAMGLLLYHLLVGRHPYDVLRPEVSRGTSRADLERLVLEVDPLPPSTAVESAPEQVAAARGVTTSQLRRHLEGDLDTIVLAALRKDPQERYPSILSVSDDIDRFLSGLPLRARPATVQYRLRKFIARNRLASMGAMTLFIVLATSTTIMFRQSRRIRAESARVVRERDKALEVRGFLLEMFSAGGPDQPTGEAVTARQLLDRRAATLGTYDDDAEMRAEMMSVLAEGYEKLGLLADAEPLARQALEVRRRLYGPVHAELVAPLNVLGWLLRMRGETQQAEPLLREAVDVGRRVFPPEGDPRLARALNDLGVIREANGDRDEAVGLYRQSLAMRRRLLGDQHLGVAITTYNLAAVLYNREDFAAADSIALVALDRFRSILGPDHQRSIIAQSLLATIRSAHGDHEGAAREHADILERRRRIFGTQHPSVAHGATMLAHEMLELKKFDEAEALLDEALTIQRAVSTFLPDEVAATHRVRGDARLLAGRLRDGLADYEAGLTLLRSTVGDGHREVPVLFARAAAAHERLGEAARARRAHEQAIRIAEHVSGPEHAPSIRQHLFFIDFLIRQRMIREALERLTRVDRLLANPDIADGERLRARAQRSRATADSISRS
jgi:serine/threonine-protein kinase